MNKRISHYKQGDLDITVKEKYTDNDHIHFNFIFQNTSSTINQPIQFQQSRTSTIIENPEEWNISVERFNIPINTIPIFNFDTTASYYITLSNAAQSDQAIQALSITNFRFFPGDNGIYSPYQWCNILNEAIAAALVTLKVLDPMFPGTAAKFYWDSDTSKFVLLVTTDWPLNASGTTGGTIYFSFKTYNLMQGFDIFEANPNATNANSPLDVCFRIQNNISNFVTYNSVNYYEFRQDSSPGTNNMFDMQTIALLTNSIPIITEGISNQTTSTNTTKNILTDFAPIYSTLITNTVSGSPIQYVPQFLRLTNMFGKQPLINLNFELNWVDKDNDYHQIYLQPKMTCNVKVVFIKKPLTS